MYYVSYCPGNGNLLTGVSKHPIPPREDLVIIEYEGDLPDLSRLEWNPAALGFFTLPSERVSQVEFLSRLQPQEYAAIKNAAAGNAHLDYYWQLFMVATEIDFQDPRTRAGLALLEHEGLLAPGRAQEIAG